MKETDYAEIFCKNCKKHWPISVSIDLQLGKSNSHVDHCLLLTLSSTDFK